MPGRVAVVQSNVDHIWFAAWHGVDSGAHAFRVRQVARRRYLLSGRWTVPGINRIHVEVFVAALVLREENVFAIATPEVDPNRPTGVGRNCFGRFKGSLCAFHPDITCPFERLDEGDELAVR